MAVCTQGRSLDAPKSPVRAVWRGQAAQLCLPCPGLATFTCCPGVVGVKSGCFSLIFSLVSLPLRLFPLLFPMVLAITMLVYCIVNTSSLTSLQLPTGEHQPRPPGGNRDVHGPEKDNWKGTCPWGIPPSFKRTDPSIARSFGCWYQNLRVLGHYKRLCHPLGFFWDPRTCQCTPLPLRLLSVGCHQTHAVLIW